MNENTPYPEYDPSKEQEYEVGDIVHVTKGSLINGKEIYADKVVFIKVSDGTWDSPPSLQELHVCQHADGRNDNLK